MHENLPFASWWFCTPSEHTSGTNETAQWALFQFFPCKVSFLFLWSPNNLYSNSWPSSRASSVPIIQPAPHTTFASSPVANNNPPEPSVPREEETFPNRSSDSTLPYYSHVLEVVNSPICSFNTAASPTSFPDDPFPEQHTTVPPSRSVFPINTSTATKTVTQRPLPTDALLNDASSHMTTCSPIRRAEDNYPRLLRSNTVNQRHATAQHILNKQLPHELKNELGLETTQFSGSSGQSITTTQSTSQTIVRNHPVHRKLHFPFPLIWQRQGSKNRSQVAGRPNTHTQKERVFHFIGIVKKRFFNESDCLHFCTHTNQFMHFLVCTLTVFWYFPSKVSSFLLFRCRSFMLKCTCFVSFLYPMPLWDSLFLMVFLLMAL